MWISNVYQKLLLGKQEPKSWTSYVGNVIQSVSNIGFSSLQAWKHIPFLSLFMYGMCYVLNWGGVCVCVCINEYIYIHSYVDVDVHLYLCLSLYRNIYLHVLQAKTCNSTSEANFVCLCSLFISFRFQVIIVASILQRDQL